MASSNRVFILLGLMLAIALLISSEVEAAKDLKTNGVEESKTHCRHGCCGYGPHGVCRCCSYAGEVKDAPTTVETKSIEEEQTTETNGVEESKTHCGTHGCCGSRPHGPCRCCSYAGEAKDAPTTVETQN